MIEKTVSELEKEVALLREELQKTKAERDAFQKLSVKDPLTKLYNRGFMEIEVPRMIAKAQRNLEYICACFIDLNHFKKINDTYGHLVGDQALQKVSVALKESTRTEDLVVRFGGDEFIVFWTAPRNCADHPLQRIAEEVSEVKIYLEGKEIKIGATIGFYCLPSSKENAYEELLRRADAIMYANKQYKD